MLAEINLFEAPERVETAQKSGLTTATKLIILFSVLIAVLVAIVVVIIVLVRKQKANTPAKDDKDNKKSLN